MFRLVCPCFDGPPVHPESRLVNAEEQPPFTQGSSAAGGGSAATDLPQHFAPPRWVHDEDADECAACGAPFTLTNRRHHCRRCGNVFCNSCTEKRSPVLALGVVEPERVCNKCHREIPAENDFISTHLPLLLKGESFLRIQMLGAKRHVMLRMLSDMSSLEISAPNEPPRYIALADVSELRAAPDSLVAFSVSTPKARTKLAAPTPAERTAWLRALGEAVRIGTAPSLKDRIEEERGTGARQMREERLRLQAERERLEHLEARRAERARFKEEISSKYSVGSTPRVGASLGSSSFSPKPSHLGSP